MTHSNDIGGPDVFDYVIVGAGSAGLPLPQLHLPYLFNADIGPSDVELLANSLLDGIGALQEARR